MAAKTFLKAVLTISLFLMVLAFYTTAHAKTGATMPAMDFI